VFLQLRSPADGLGVRLEHGDRRCGPVRLLVRHEDEDVDPEAYRRAVFQLRDAECVALGDMPATKSDEQDAQLAILDPLLGQHLRLVARGSPPFHRIDEEPRPGQPIDDVGAMSLQIAVRRRYEGADHVSRIPV
jgi:hypothetical protein